jgi:RNA polymerase primary sigma factor
MGRLAQDQRRALRLPARAKADLSSLKRAGNRLMAERGREAPLRDVAGAAGVDLDRAEAILNAARPAGSLEQPLGDDETLTLVDVLADPRAEGAYDDVVSEAAAPQLGALLRALSEREREVVERRHGLGDRDEESLAEIGRRLGVSRERARQIEARALAKMRLPQGRGTPPPPGPRRVGQLAVPASSRSSSRTVPSPASIVSGSRAPAVTATRRGLA